MKNSKILIAVLSGVVAFAFQGWGQTIYQVTVKGTSLTTNDSGAIVTTKVSNNTFIQDAVKATGTTNSAKSLALVYVQGASTDPGVQGDFIEVVNTTNGSPVYTNLQFMYNSPFPAALTNADGSQVVIGAEVIPLPLAGSGDSLGGAAINERILSKKVVIRGTYNYTALRSPTATANDEVLVCSGTFNVGKIFTIK
ncbi:MAG TPA: hypothetical protein VG938_04715 [Verrucomicrobiae bacterium]|jgi:hypothetical protein|nr:hypothetical protein [Verrucomicrobiae bacterium]